jgi:hypothetical protein
MSDELNPAGKKWKIGLMIAGVVIGLVITDNDDLFELLGLKPDMRFPYQLLGTIASGCLGAWIGGLIDRARARRVKQ